MLTLTHKPSFGEPVYIPPKFKYIQNSVNEPWLVSPGFTTGHPSSMAPVQHMLTSKPYMCLYEAFGFYDQCWLFLGGSCCCIHSSSFLTTYQIQHLDRGPKLTKRNTHPFMITFKSNMHVFVGGSWSSWREPEHVQEETCKLHTKRLPGFKNGHPCCHLLYHCSTVLPDLCYMLHSGLSETLTNVLTM